MAHFAGNAQWAEPSPLSAHRARPSPLNYKKRVLGSLGEETAVQAVVGSIVCAFRRIKKPKSREMSARGYAIHSVCTQLSFLQGFDVHAKLKQICLLTLEKSLRHYLVDCLSREGQWTDDERANIRHLDQIEAVYSCQSVSRSADILQESDKT